MDRLGRKWGLGLLSSNVAELLRKPSIAFEDFTPLKYRLQSYRLMCISKMAGTTDCHGGTAFCQTMLRSLLPQPCCCRGSRVSLVAKTFSSLIYTALKLSPSFLSRTFDHNLSFLAAAAVKSGRYQIRIRKSCRFLFLPSNSNVKRLPTLELHRTASCVSGRRHLLNSDLTISQQ